MYPGTLKTSDVLSEELKSKIINFFTDDSISRVMPGLKDFKSVIENEVRKQKQKRLILCNLKKTFQLFKEFMPGEK
jgi:hypothetical protein